jgi:hypothetical protein
VSASAPRNSGPGAGSSPASPRNSDGAGAIWASAAVVGLAAGLSAAFSSPAATSPGQIRLERLRRSSSADNPVCTRRSRALAGRDNGCAFYEIQTHWRLDPGEQMRVSSAKAGE